MTKPQRTPQKSESKLRERTSARSTSDLATGARDKATTSRPRRQVVTDPRAMRALAHPLRVALLETMRRDGDITASRAGELLGESPGNMSWHLQTLAKYGFVEETGEGRGRSRPWRLTSDSRSFDTGMTDPESAAAGEALERTFVERAYGEMREWWSRRLTYPLKWRRAAFMTDTVRYLTAQELARSWTRYSRSTTGTQTARSRKSAPPERSPCTSSHTGTLSCLLLRATNPSPPGRAAQNSHERVRPRVKALQSPPSSAAAARPRPRDADGRPIVERAASVLISLHARTQPTAQRIAPARYAS